jgi:hypothetical protein
LTQITKYWAVMILSEEHKAMRSDQITVWHRSDYGKVIRSASALEQTRGLLDYLEQWNDTLISDKLALHSLRTEWERVFKLTDYFQLHKLLFIFVLYIFVFRMTYNLYKSNKVPGYLENNISLKIISK